MSMKKIIIFVLLLLNICFLSSCKKAESSKNGNDVIPGFIENSATI